MVIVYELFPWLCLSCLVCCVDLAAFYMFVFRPPISM